MKLIRAKILASSWVLLLMGAPFFFLGGPGYSSPRSFQAAWDLGHILFFAIMALWLHTVLHRKIAFRSPLLECIALFALILVIGFVVELLQMLTSSRSPDMSDLLRNQLGCVLAFAFWIQPAPLRTARRMRWFRLTVWLLLALTVWPLARALVDEQLAARQFPLLADFETPFERYRWLDTDQLREETEKVRHGRKAVRVQLSTAKYSGIALFHFPPDWRGYQALHYSVYNPYPSDLVLNCRIHDALHRKNGMIFADRFNQQLTLHEGWNDVVVSLEKVRTAPRGRTMDMARIEGFGLFVVQQEKPLELYLDHVYLSR